MSDSLPAYKINSELAYLSGGWCSELAEALLVQRPKQMSLVGNWPDLGMFSGLVDSVEGLTIEGSLDNGRINAIHNIGVFKHLKRLHLVSKVKASYDLSGLLHLRRLHGDWQTDMGPALRLPNLEYSHINNYPAPDFAGFPAAPALHHISLGRPALTSLAGMSGMSCLRELEIHGGRKLTSLQGLAPGLLTRLVINEARQLIETGAVAGSSLASVKFLHVSAGLDLAPLSRTPGLRRIHVAGKDAPLLPWLGMLGNPNLEMLAGVWDPACVSEDALRNALPQGRELLKFERAKPKGVTPLVLKMGPAGKGVCAAQS